MIQLDQSGRPLKVTTPLGQNAVVCESFSGEEHVNRLFRFDLELLSTNQHIEPERVLGQSITASVETASGSWRYFNGICNSFEYKGGDYIGGNQEVHYYSMRIVPQLWLLTKKTNCKVHCGGSGNTVPDILTALLSGITVSNKLTGTYERRDYCVQYQETDFDFFTRLLEEEGIFYFFEHADGSHKLVLADNVSAFADNPESQVEIKTSQADSSDHLRSWNHSREIISGKQSHTDYNFETSTANLNKEKDTRITGLPISQLEVYEYPALPINFQGIDASGGEKPSDLTKEAPDIERRATNRMEAEEAQHEVLFSSSERRMLTPGTKIQVTEHYNSAEKGSKWILTHVQHRANSSGYLAGGGSSSGVYSNTFRAIPDTRLPRPRHTRRKPQIFGVQSAIVTGPAGQEIFTDKYGRVKVQFPWDRTGRKDENSSCWLRTVTPWAGTNWGMIAIPRIGQEVIVSFVNGDIDRPIAMGMVYNDQNMPPYELPDNKTQSGIKTRSTKEGTDENFNELRFEDKKDEEQIYVHAEKNFDCVIENNETRKIGFDKKDKGDQTIDIFNNQTLKVGAEDCADGSQTVEIYNHQNLKVGVGAGNGSQTEEIQKDRTATINTGNDKLTIKQGNQTVELTTGNQNITLKKGNQTTTVDNGNITTKASLGKITLEAMQSIELKVGGSSIKIEPAAITITSVQIKIDGSGSAEVKGGGMAKVEAGGMLTLKGAIAKIN